MDIISSNHHVCVAKEFTDPEGKVIVQEAFFSNLNSGEWVIEDKRCWFFHCGSKGGACDFCNNGSQKGYCCRKDGIGGNGDCPKYAIDAIPHSIGPHHTCVSRKTGENEVITRSFPINGFS